MQPKLRLWILILIPLAIMSVNPWPLWDLGIWTGYGQRLWESWGFLYQDSISILPTDNNITSSWLASLAYASLYKLGGFQLLMYLHMTLLAALLYLIYTQTILQNSSATLYERLAIYSLWLGAGSYFSPRPNLIAFLWLFWAYETLEFKVLTKKEWFKLLVLQLLWVNTHGSFILLPLMAAWTILFQKKWTLGNLFGFTSLALACLANPWGWKIFPYILKTREYSRWVQIEEWMPVTSIENPAQFIAFWGLILFILSLLFKKIKIFTSPFTVLVLISFAGLRISAFSFIVLPLFLKKYTNLFAKNKIGSNQKNWPLVLVFSLALALNIFSLPPLKQRLNSFFPEKFRNSYDSPILIAKTINQYPDKRCAILNEMSLGGFLMMETQNPLLIDGRVTPFTRQAFETYFALLDLEKTDIIQTSHACFAIFSQQDHPELIEALKKNFNFKPIKTELGYILLQRTKTN